MDLAVVSQGWYREFHRLRRCLPRPPKHSAAAAARAEEPVPVSFSLKLKDFFGLHAGSSVHVAGSWNGWTWHKLTYAPAAAAGGAAAGGAGGASADVGFAAVLMLKPGSYQYKFVVDGSSWLHSPSAPQVKDAGGNSKWGEGLNGEGEEEGGRETVFWLCFLVLYYADLRSFLLPSPCPLPLLPPPPAVNNEVIVEPLSDDEL